MIREKYYCDLCDRELVLKTLVAFDLEDEKLDRHRGAPRDVEVHLCPRCVSVVALSATPAPKEEES